MCVYTHINTEATKRDKSFKMYVGTVVAKYQVR